MGSVMRTPQQTETLQIGFKKWLTAPEIAAIGLPGVPTCSRSARRYVASLREEGSPFLWRFKSTAEANGTAHQPRGIEVHYSALPLEAVVAYEARHNTSLAAAQPDDKRLARLGTGILSVAEGGQLRALILQRLMADPRAPVVAIRDRCFERFGPEVVVIAQGVPTLVPMPSFRTFQCFVQALRETGAVDARR